MNIAALWPSRSAVCSSSAGSGILTVAIAGLAWRIPATGPAGGVQMIDLTSVTGGALRRRGLPMAGTTSATCRLLHVPVPADTGGWIACHPPACLPG